MFILNPSEEVKPLNYKEFFNITYEKWTTLSTSTKIPTPTTAKIGNITHKRLVFQPGKKDDGKESKRMIQLKMIENAIRIKKNLPLIPLKKVEKGPKPTTIKRPWKPRILPTATPLNESEIARIRALISASNERQTINNKEKFTSPFSVVIVVQVSTWYFCNNPLVDFMHKFKENVDLKQ